MAKDKVYPDMPDYLDLSAERKYDCESDTEHDKRHPPRSYDISPNCPYCGKLMPKVPRAKAKCKSCGQPVYPRFDVCENLHLVKESELEFYQMHYDMHTGCETRIENAVTVASVTVSMFDERPGTPPRSEV